MAKPIKYAGEFLKSRSEALQLDAYHPSPSLKEAVNLALFLEQPLLLMGEPGCGKTRLAEAVAAELHGANWRNHYFRWDIKSTSKAKEGIYYYDALNRLYDVNTKNVDATRIEKYISYGKFATALSSPQNGDLPNVLLIDEIDKADIDFPNDLLLEIERGEFIIPEINRQIVGLSKVVIFITSNRERELPPAFLRRCLFFYIDFPSFDVLREIISAKFSTAKKSKLVEGAVRLFLDIRQKIDSQFAENEKRPSTSELLEWFRVIDEYNNQYEQGMLDDEGKQILDLVLGYETGEVELQKIPFQQVLLKTIETNLIFNRNV